MDLLKKIETRKPHIKRYALITHHLMSSYSTIQVSYEGFKVEPSLLKKSTLGSYISA
jgi:hypothetical protein